VFRSIAAGRRSSSILWPGRARFRRQQLATPESCQELFRALRHFFFDMNTRLAQTHSIELLDEVLEFVGDQFHRIACGEEDDLGLVDANPPLHGARGDRGSARTACSGSGATTRRRLPSVAPRTGAD
jgi:hypothetical protein